MYWGCIYLFEKYICGVCFSVFCDNLSSTRCSLTGTSVVFASSLFPCAINKEALIYKGNFQNSWKHKYKQFFKFCTNQPDLRDLSWFA